MAQYTSCPDPTESAARKERMRQAEVNGESEEIALRMAQTRLEASNSPAPRQTGEQDNQGSKKRIPAALRLGPPNEPDMDDEGNNEGRRPISLERTHVTQRLGPLGGSQSVDITQTEPEKSNKCKPGRPPGERKVRDSPKSANGTSTNRRKTTNSKPPTVRRKLNPSVPEKNHREKKKQIVSRGFPCDLCRTTSISDKLRRLADLQHDPTLSKEEAGFRTPADLQHDPTLSKEEAGFRTPADLAP